jgi:hypothetical protein
MSNRLSVLALVVLSGLLLVGAPALALAGETDIAIPGPRDDLEGNCYLALSPEAPRLFEIEFGRDNNFNASVCSAPGSYDAGQEFLIFTLWNASCPVDNDTLSFDGLAIGGVFLFFRADGGPIDTRALAFRVPCGVLP